MVNVWLLPYTGEVVRYGSVDSPYLAGLLPGWVADAAVVRCAAASINHPTAGCSSNVMKTVPDRHEVQDASGCYRLGDAAGTLWAAVASWRLQATGGMAVRPNFPWIKTTRSVCPNPHASQNKSNISPFHAFL